MLALMGAFASLSASAQVLPPAHPYLALPKATDMVVRGNVKTSNYGYDNVNFQVAPSVWQPQNLHVYSFNAENELPGGIAWVRRNPATNAIVDTGWISVPGTKYCRNVGIVQSSANLTYVIASYFQAGSATTPARYLYETYAWTAAGVNPIPSPPVELTVSVPYISWWTGPGVYYPIGNRISMDCYDLKKVVFAWEEGDFSYRNMDSALVEVNQGGINVNTLEISIGSPAPFPFDVNGNKRIVGSEYWGRMPDVAFGMSGNTVRVAYIDTDTLLPVMKDIVISNRGYAAVSTAATGPLAFTLDDLVPGATQLHSGGNGDHLNLDCPDHFDTDIWSIVYSPAVSPVIFAHTKGIMGAPVNTMISSSLPGLSAHPVVAYTTNPPSQGINYGWYNQGTGYFLSTTLEWDGATFSTATPVGTYRGIDGYMPGSGLTFYMPKIAFNRQNDRNGTFKMAYPMPLAPAVPLYVDMRSKYIPWGSAFFRPTNIEEIKTINFAVEAHPNPFTNGIQIIVNNADEKAAYTAILTDVQGKVVLQTEGLLTDVNQQLAAISNIASGNYFLSVNSKDGSVKGNIKLVRN